MSEHPFSPASERNKQPILAVLLHLLSPTGRALEVASGTGQHVAWFAAHLPLWYWQPTDLNASAFNGIRSRTAQMGLANVAEPVLLDVLAPVWVNGCGGQDPTMPAVALPSLFDLIFCANMLHIAPWACCAGLMQGAARHLAPGGHLITYGPYLEDRVPTASGNVSFDASLKSLHPDWGIRRREDVEIIALQAGLHLSQRFEMPANNLLLVWRVNPSPQSPPD